MHIQPHEDGHLTTGGGRHGTPASIGRLAREAAARGGQRPFVTFYDDATGERTELGHATLHNWVSKTANLLHGELDLGPGRALALRLGTHWTTLVVLLAAWRSGVLVRRDGLDEDRPVAGAGALVVGEDRAGEITDPERTIVVGAGLGGRLLGDGHGALEFATEVLACDDEFDDPALDRDTPALAAPESTGGRSAVLTHGDLLDLAAATVEALELRPGRRLLLGYPLETLEAVAVVLAGLAADASVVLVAHAAGDRQPGRVAAERCDLAVAPAGGPDAGGASARALTVERDPGGAVTGIRVLP